VADGGGAQPESARERGLPVAGGGGPGAGSGGEARALERRSRRGVGTGERVEQHERGASGSAAVRQRGKRREKVGVPGVGLVGYVRRARACRTERGREASDGWAAAQCRAAVPLTGGAGLSAGTVESAGARGPTREESRVAEPR
jgi:hypothetical protein